MRILTTSTPGMGHLNSILPLSIALRAAGHEVLFVTASESCGLVRDLGFAVQAGGMAAADRRASLAPRMPEILALPPRRRRGVYFSGFFAEAAAPMMRNDLKTVFDEFRPDLVIHELAELAAAPMAVARDIPHVTVAFSGALPQWSDALTIQGIAPLWAAEGLPVPTIDDLGGDLYLHPFPPSFGQVPDSGVVQPMRAESLEHDAGQRPRWLDDLGTFRPLIYVTAGTEPASGMAPWAATIAALGAMNVDAIATIGAHLDMSVLGNVPPNVRVERFVPQRFVLDQATVTMSHGGAGSLLGAARRGLPQLLAPLVADQWENADAAFAAGVAITCELDQRTDTELGAALHRLLHDVRFRDAASEVAQEIADMPSPADCVKTIEALLTDRN
ncbi:MAG: glycosyltransferase [Ilumatobacteraceae bacterium]